MLLTLQAQPQLTLFLTLQLFLTYPVIGAATFSYRQTDQADDMFEPKASWSSDPAGGRKMWEPRQGQRHLRSPFLWLLSFGEAKESDRLPGRPRQASTE
ncbi:hypothetical protein ACVBEF_19010 [Glaciimonas sp. GG7]